MGATAAVGVLVGKIVGDTVGPKAPGVEERVGSDVVPIMGVRICAFVGNELS